MTVWLSLELPQALLLAARLAARLAELLVPLLVWHAGLERLLAHLREPLSVPPKAQLLVPLEGL